MTARAERRLTVPRRARSVLARWVKPRASVGRRAEDLGDFARRAPRRDAAGRCVYEALAAGVLESQGERLTGTGAIVTPDFGRLAGPAPGERTHVVRVATADAATQLQRLEERFGGAQLDWVVVDRCLQFVPDIAPALAHVAGWLKPGGTLISLSAGVARAEPEARRPLWTVLPYAARRMHEDCAALGPVEIEQRGNVALALAWLYGLDAEELTDAELRSVDGAYPVLVAAIAARRGAAPEVGG